MKVAPRTKLLQISQGLACGLQYGALCYRIDNGKLRVLLITSRRTGRWIVPKGWPIAGLDGSAAAAQEAWEEAGVSGRCTDRSIGFYYYDKVLDGAETMTCMVRVYGLKVAKLAESFPEKEERRRRWFSPKKAAIRVDEPQLAQMIRKFDPRLLR